MTFLTGYLAQGVGGPGAFVENAASGYARATVTLTDVGGGNYQLSSNASNGAVTGSQLAVYDAATGGNQLLYWGLPAARLFGDAAADLMNAGKPSFTFPALSGAAVSVTNYAAGQQVAITYAGSQVYAGVASRVVNDVLSAVTTATTGGSGTIAFPSVTRLTASGSLPSTSGPVSIRQTAAGTYTLPTAPADGTTIPVKDAGKNFNTFNATFLPGAGDTIEGASNYVMNTLGQEDTFDYDAINKNWDVS